MNPSTERILAVDPGYDRCGVAVLTKSASLPDILYSTCITTNKKDAQEKRLADIYYALEKVIIQWQPTALALETIFFSVNKKTAIKVAEARGAILLLAGTTGLPLIELSPQEVKLSMTGVGNAKKEQVQKMVSLTLKLDTSKRLDDEIDAIALGAAALQKVRVENFKKSLA
ncbi:crossover junction endodeoxyribonuclease RuvC [Candidatus Nomurabacteria bacterium]|nr:crossover junction endodeoxyribonuclease RuvC [Candidatus Nomurabacteria bacterium]